MLRCLLRVSFRDRSEVFRRSLFLTELFSIVGCIHCTWVDETESFGCWESFYCFPFNIVKITFSFLYVSEYKSTTNSFYIMHTSQIIHKASDLSSVPALALLNVHYVSSLKKNMEQVILKIDDKYSEDCGFCQNSS